MKQRLRRRAREPMRGRFGYGEIPIEDQPFQAGLDATWLKSFSKWVTLKFAIQVPAFYFWPTVKRWPSLSRLVLRYSSACLLGVTSQGTRSTTLMPARSRA